MFYKDLIDYFSNTKSNSESYIIDEISNFRNRGSHFDLIRGTNLLSIFYFFVYNNVFTTTSGGIPHITSGPPPKIG